MRQLAGTLAAILLSVTTARAHDTWVETNTNLVRQGDAVYVDLKLGNHGNEHRDFKLASKISLDGCTLDVIDANGKSFPLVDELIDTGYAPKEGYWTAKFTAAKPGLYTVAHRLDKVVNHGRPVRSIRSAKTVFLVSPTLDHVKAKPSGFDRRLGHALEIVPKANHVAPMGPGEPIRVQVWLKGKPLAGTRVSFIPHGHELKAGFDDDYERKTDANGLASFTPKTGNRCLVVADHRDETEKGSDYDLTAYSATLTVFVPEVCPCCGE